MNTDYRTIVIGAGAAGLFAASMLQNGKNLLIEKNSSAGKKLLISGAGQCNYTHEGELDDFIKKYGSNSSFLRPALYNFSNYDSMEYFKGLGMESIIREDGKVFPKSLKSSDILSLLLSTIKRNGNTEIKYNMQVKDIVYNKELEFFTVKTDDGKYTAQNVIITTGGKSYPNTGSTGDGYTLAEGLGHTIIETSPCLTPFNVKNYPFKELSGISFKNINISIWRDNKKLKDVYGDLLLTHKNISGPVILNVSKYARPGDIVKLNFINMPADSLNELIDRKAKENGSGTVKAVFKDTEISKRFIEEIFSINELDERLILSQLPKVQRIKLVKSLTSYEFEIESLGGYHIAMATTGGVSLQEVNRKTMQSKLVNGLYFAGEVLDIDGETGGYNIQAAFSTAALAVKSIENQK